MEQDIVAILHTIIAPVGIFIIGALASRCYDYFKGKMKKDAVFVTPEGATTLLSAHREKCHATFATFTDLEKLHRTIMDEAFQKFATREEAGKIEQALNTLHDDVKSDFKDVKEQLFFISKHLMEHR